ncbi:MAG: DUF4434 domain-containing protein [Candidatus Hydrogenedentes bacterium]|nr:DUF4434 domain-containing protein [Candidatus Hydrogenedentota bacterium]
MRRAAFCTLALLLAASALGCARFGHAPPRAGLIGTLWWMTPEDAQRPVAEWRDDLDRLQALGLNLLILNGPFVGAPDAGAGDPMLALFAELDRRGMRVFIDTLAAPHWWTLDDPAGEIERACARVRMLEGRYGAYDCFEGFYIPYELYVFWGERAGLIRRLYGEVSACCKQVAPERPVMISPFFILDRAGILGDFRWAEPAEYQAFWTHLLAQADIDIVALQDSGEHLSFYTLADRAPFFEAMAAACRATDTALWANIETGELAVRDAREYVERFGEKTHVNDPSTRPYWRGVPADKLAVKLEFAGAYTPTAITWGYREFIRPALGDSAAALYAAYCEQLRK